MRTLLLTLLVAVQGVAYASDDKPEIGRYQLLYAVIHDPENGRSEEKTVWKIDTVTGQVWRFAETPQGGGAPFFEPIKTDQPH